MDGTAGVAGRVRTRHQGLEFILERVEETRIKECLLHAGVLEAGVEGEALAFASQVKERFPCAEIYG